MANKVKTTFFCQNCGSQYSKWQGQCNSCKEWNTIAEEIIQKEEKILFSCKCIVPAKSGDSAKCNYWCKSLITQHTLESSLRGALATKQSTFFCHPRARSEKENLPPRISSHYLVVRHNASGLSTGSHSLYRCGF